jgi:CheY-like chemotaxis protein
MRILFAHNEKTDKTRYSQVLGKFGSMDCFTNGRDTILSFVNGFQTGNRYDLLVIEYDLKQLDGLEALVMIRKYELEHLMPYKKTLVVFSSKEQHCKSSYETRHGADGRITFQSNPVTATLLECIAEKIVGENSRKASSGLARYKRPVNMLA